MGEKYKKFCIVHFKQMPPGLTSGTYHCIPNTWIRCENEPNQVTVAYPQDMTRKTMYSLRKGEAPGMKWPLYPAVVKSQIDHYEEWQHWASLFGKSQLIEQLSAKNVETNNQTEQNIEEDVSTAMANENENIEVLLAPELLYERSNCDELNTSSESVSNNIIQTSLVRKRQLIDESPISNSKVDVVSKNKLFKRSTADESVDLLSDADNMDDSVVRTDSAKSSSSHRVLNSTPIMLNDEAKSNIDSRKAIAVQQFDEAFLRQLHDICKQVCSVLTPILENIDNSTSDE